MPLNASPYFCRLEQEPFYLPLYYIIISKCYQYSQFRPTEAQCHKFDTSKKRLEEHMDIDLTNL